MRKRIIFLLMLALALCSAFLVSCENSTEDLDHVHDYIERTIDADCTNDGRKEKICIVCSNIEVLSAVPAKGHNPNDWQTKTEATCTVNKVEERICKDCNAVVETKVHPVIGHDLGEWQVITDASCTQNLIEGKICRVCATVVETKVGSKIQHDYIQAVIGSTCLVGEHVLHTCRFCGDTYESDFSKPNEAHVDGGWVVDTAPTCTSDGIRKKICSVCSKGLSFEPIAMDPNNHSFMVETFLPEGDNEGYVKYTCKLCQFEMVNEYEANFLPSQIYEMIVSSTVRIEGCDKNGNMHNLGSGFFISDKGEIVTNYHVIAGAYQLKVKLYGGEQYWAVQVKGYDIKNDIAVIKIDLEGNSYLKLSTDSVKTGDPVYALGSPLGVDDIFTDGVVSNPSKLINGVYYIAFSAPISTGNSGGPLVNSRGEVVGINSQTAIDSQNLNFALPASVAAELDKSGEKTVHEVYLETLGISGINTLTYYVVLNYDKVTSDGKYIVSKTLVEESQGTYGRILRITYDKEAKALSVSVNWVEGGKDLYTIEILLDSIGESYEIRMFDHVWSQYTAEGTISTKEQAINVNGTVDSSVYFKIFKFDYINYPESGGTLTKSAVRQLFGMAYIYTLNGMNELFAETETELTLEHFNLQLPYVEGTDAE